MPRISITEERNRCEQIRKNLVYLKHDTGNASRSIAKHMELSQPTVLKRFAHPEQLTVGDLFTLSRLFNVKMETILCGRAGITRESQP